MTSSAIELRGVAKSFGDVRAVDNVSLAIGRGEMFGLIGHNGAGKTTLFKLMLGLLAADAGTIEVEGRRVDGPQFREVRRRVGYLPENVVFWDNLSGLETLRFFARLKGVDAAQCAPALERVGLRPAGPRRVRGYSKGMRQRLGFAQALLGEPAILFLDEPTAGLDPEGRRALFRSLDELRGGGVTIVLSSHVLAELQQRVDRLAIMGNGRLEAVGTLDALRRERGLRLHADLRVRDGARRALAAALGAAGFEPLALRDGVLRIVCLPDRKMALLAALAPLLSDLLDVQMSESSLEDLLLGHS